MKQVICLLIVLLSQVLIAYAQQNSPYIKTTHFEFGQPCQSAAIGAVVYENNTNLDCVPQPCYMAQMHAQSIECVDHVSPFPSKSLTFYQSVDPNNCNAKVKTISNVKLGVCLQQNVGLLLDNIFSAYYKVIDCETIQVFYDSYDFGCNGGYYNVKIKQGTCTNGVYFKCSN